MPSSSSHCVGCGKPMRARISCPNCGKALCSEVCVRRHVKFAHHGQANAAGGGAIVLLLVIGFCVNHFRSGGDEEKSDQKSPQQTEEQLKAEQRETAKRKRLLQQQRSAAENLIRSEEAALQGLQSKLKTAESQMKSSGDAMDDIQAGRYKPTGDPTRDSLEFHRQAFQSFFRESEQLQQSITQQQAKVDHAKKQLEALPR